ncbi:hypothetical protein J31TS6_56930 [Brevibacillus reuszeri]|uniref:hypothetical protein n=1 Tax=Brevibacillus reuszeri TaxID=54915 RepID=UPI001B182AE7|nr:hypothetical protein [Brevibacillus reuszeri]GIO09665.1 hypothetical protein J31TS6_56930 [Brevibacillus reuszeri]
MNFKDQLSIDLSVFFNIDEFGEIHNIDGRDLLVVIDKDVSAGRKRKGLSDYYSMSEGLHISKIMLYARVSDFPVVPTADSQMKIDEEYYRVVDCDKQMGVLEIELEGNQS